MSICHRIAIISVRRSSLAEQAGAGGVNVFIGSDQVRFYRDLREIPVDDIPAIVYSEVMRDVDLFTTVAAVGDDSTWSDQGHRGTGVFSERFDVNDFSATTALRAEVLSRVLPATPIAEPLHDRQSVARGARTARDVSDSAGMGRRDAPDREHHAVAEDSAKHCGRSTAGSGSAIQIDIDPRTEMILRTAFILGDDWRIDAPELVRQLMPE